MDHACYYFFKRMHNESLLHVSEICHLSSLILIFETGLLGNLIFNRCSFVKSKHLLVRQNLSYGKFFCSFRIVAWRNALTAFKGKTDITSFVVIYLYFCLCRGWVEKVWKINLELSGCWKAFGILGGRLLKWTLEDSSEHLLNFLRHSGYAMRRRKRRVPFFFFFFFNAVVCIAKRLW